MAQLSIACSNRLLIKVYCNYALNIVRFFFHMHVLTFCESLFLVAHIIVVVYYNLCKKHYYFIGQLWQLGLGRLTYICLLFSGFSNVYHFACVWPTALKLGCITNFDMLRFLVMGFISLVGVICIMSIIGGKMVYIKLYIHQFRNVFSMRILQLQSARRPWRIPGPNTVTILQGV